MKITFLGAARSVTGSMHLLQVNSSHILLECGLFQGRREESYQRNRNLPLDAGKLDAMVLSHAHIDHSGNIPNLVRSGFAGNIYATFATRDLCSIMLQDSAHIMEGDVGYLNKKRKQEGLPLLEPIYTASDATAALRNFVSIGYGRPIPIAPGVILTFYDAGHILGSALCALDIDESGRRYRFLFTGDLGRKGMLILRDPEVVPQVDYLLTESTYGGRQHGTPEDAEEELKRVVNETFKRRGKVIIPSFSVGRTQEIVYALHRLSNANQIPHLPVYVDSPLSTNATDVFRLHPEAYDAETLAFMEQYRDPFGFGQLRYVQNTDDSKALNTRDDPMIIITASGMCESGRILHHLKHNISNERNTILFVGFQAENTLGRRILDGEKDVPILGERFPVRARLEHIDGYSAHADHDELLSYIRDLQPDRLSRVLIVHGDVESALAVQQGLRELGVKDSYIPQLNEEVNI
jgi:metallo-beta-lactamase family protein